MISYKSYSDLALLVLTSPKLSTRNYDLVLGIPKSGLIPALIISSSKNIPMGDTTSILSGMIVENGSTTTSIKRTVDLNESLNVLIVDDSYHSGKSFAEVREKIQMKYPQWNTYCFGVYASSKPKTGVSCLELLNPPHLFQWNIFKNKILEKSCLDIDGVLCNDSELDEYKDTMGYRDYLATAPRKNIPFGICKAIVSGRRESYLDVTASWLAGNSIEYQYLHHFPDNAKKNQEAIAQYKARIFAKSDCQLFIESNDLEAKLIHVYSKKPVYCVDSATLYQSHNSIVFKSKRYLNKYFFKKHLARFLPEIVKKVLRRRLV